MKIKTRSLSIVTCSLLLAAAVAFCQTPQPGPFGGPPPTPQDLGKTFIVGELQKVENTKLTIHRPDGVDQTIQVDDKTKLLDGRGETIKLADFKTGDRVAGTGALKDDVFLATELRKAPTDVSGPPAPPRLPFQN